MSVTSMHLLKSLLEKYTLRKVREQYIKSMLTAMNIIYFTQFTVIQIQKSTLAKNAYSNVSKPEYEIMMNGQDHIP